jgi:hypothetical protein
LSTSKKSIRPQHEAQESRLDYQQLAHVEGQGFEAGTIPFREILSLGPRNQRSPRTRERVAKERMQHELPHPGAGHFHSAGRIKHISLAKKTKSLEAQ